MKKAFSVFLFMSLSIMTSAQAITNVKTTLIENEYGNARLLVEPLVIDMHAKKPSKSYEVYAILICYIYKDKQKVLHQDLTYDFEKKGKKELFLGMGAKKNNVTIGNILFYRRDLTTPDKMPKKSDCFQ